MFSVYCQIMRSHFHQIHHRFWRAAASSQPPVADINTISRRRRSGRPPAGRPAMESVAVSGKPLYTMKRAKRNSTIRVPETFAKVVAPIRREGGQIARLAQEFLVCRIRLVQIYNIGNAYA